MDYSVTAERAVDGVRVIEEGLAFNDAVERASTLYTDYRDLSVKADFMPTAVQVQVRRDGAVLFRCGSI